MPPTVLIHALHSIRRRVRLLEAVFGIGILLAATVTLVLTISVADYILDLPPIARIFVLMIALTAILFVLYQWIARPLSAKLSLSDIAGQLERAFPQFQDRLRSTVDIVSGQLPGSEAMKQRVVFEASSLAQTFDLNRAVVMKPVWYATGAGLGSIVLGMMMLLMIGAQYRDIAMSRLLLPFGNHPWPKTVKIDLVGTVADRVAVGQRFDVNIHLSRGDRASRKAVIFYQYGDDANQHFGPTEQEYMTRGDDGVYHASLDARIVSEAAAAGSMKIWMASGDDQINLQPVKVVQRLTIKNIQARITPPKYANLAPITVNLAQNPAVATFGSNVELTVTFNKPLDSNKPATIEPFEQADDTRPIPITWTSPAAKLITGQLTAENSLRFRLHAVDIDGFQNTAVEEYEINVKPDQNPTVQIENPRRNEDRTPVAVIPFQALAEDDYGIKSLMLIVNRLDDKKHWEIPLVSNAGATSGASWNKIDAGGDLQRFRSSYSWDLSALKDAQLKAGDVLEYFALVQDNFDLNGKTHAPVPSGRLRINIISQEDFTNKVTDELRAIGEQITQVKVGQNRTQRETATLNKETLDKPNFDAADKVATDRLANQQSTAASQAKQLSGKLDAINQQLEENKSPNQELKDTSRDVSSLLNNTAESPMKDAAGQINSAKQASAKDDRNQALQQAQANQQLSNNQLQKALDRMGNIGSLSRTIDQIKAILEEQAKLSAETQAIGKNNLGKRPEEMSADDRAKLEKIAKDQADLAARTDKALADMQSTAEKMAKSDPTAAQAMKEAAATGQQQNVSPNQQKASSAARQNQQSQAQSAQKQAELGLQMMLNSLRDAERRKLEELARKLTDLQKQLANLIRRQAGHNLDNLALQGSGQVGKLETKLRQSLFTDAERDAKNPPTTPEIGNLSNAQEQTERNTRDMAKVAGDLPDGAEPADRLTEASDKMERAIVNLRDNKLADAYNPPQVEALLALHAAKAIVDQQKASADQKQQDQQKESIRLAYVKIKADQEKLNAQTKQIDAAPRFEDGSLHREDAVRLGQLPGEQGALADRAAKLDEDLSSLGSIVYIWANKDLITTMHEVKDDLGKPVTGAPTQAEQKRIVAQLDAMIRDLMTKPIESKFAQRGGGGSGKCSPGLPSEAELRLLKDLQLAVNDSTKEIAALPNKDQPKLLALGNRQGEMRNLLDQLLQKSSGGQMKLGPEPDNRDQLPEEANTEQVDNQELDKTLLDDKPGAEVVQKDLDLVGDRMARARQRLAMNNDPGKITQAIQDRITSNLDDLIEMARKKEAQTQGQPPDPNARPQQAMNKPKPDSGVQPQNTQAKSGIKKQGGSTPAGNTYTPSGGSAAADISTDIHQKMAEWGGITPRQREAVIEGAGEQVIDKYKNLVDDYYRSLATKTNGQ